MLAFILLAAVSTIVSSPSSSTTHEGLATTKEYDFRADDDTVPAIVERGSYVGISNERSGTVVPQFAKCMPEKRVVKLRKSPDLSLVYHPSCTRVERCGGCCNIEEFFSCQPTEIEYINFKVTVNKYIGKNILKNIGKEIIRVERHLKCKCGCIVKASDCNHLQEYVEQECKCMCTNHDEKRKCLEDDPKLKFWDPSDCSCQCSDVKECSTGYTFNKHTCRCEPEQTQKINHQTSELRSSHRRPEA